MKCNMEEFRREDRKEKRDRRFRREARNLKRDFSVAQEMPNHRG